MVVRGLVRDEPGELLRLHLVVDVLGPDDVHDLALAEREAVHQRWDAARRVVEREDRELLEHARGDLEHVGVHEPLLWVVLDEPALARVGLALLEGHAQRVVRDGVERVAHEEGVLERERDVLVGR